MLATHQHRPVSQYAGESLDLVKADILKQSTQGVDPRQEPIVDCFLRVWRVLYVSDGMQRWLSTANFIRKRLRHLVGRINSGFQYQ